MHKQRLAFNDIKPVCKGRMWTRGCVMVAAKTTPLLLFEVGGYPDAAFVNKVLIKAVLIKVLIKVSMLLFRVTF